MALIRSLACWVGVHFIARSRSLNEQFSAFGISREVDMPDHASQRRQNHAFRDIFFENRSRGISQAARSVAVFSSRTDQSAEKPILSAPGPTSRRRGRSLSSPGPTSRRRGGPYRLPNRPVGGGADPYRLTNQTVGRTRIRRRGFDGRGEGARPTPPGSVRRPAAETG